MVAFAFDNDGVEAVFAQALTSPECISALTVIGREFEEAGWGSSYSGRSAHLIHPLHLTRHVGPGQGPSTLTAALAANGGDPVGRALDAAGHDRQAAAWRTAVHPGDPRTRPGSAESRWPS